MCPCSPNDVNFPVPSGPSGPAIPGFGIPFALPTPAIPIPDGFPEDLLDILNKLEMLIPPGALKAPLNPNFGKDIFDAIMKLLDQFMPFLMLYKFFLPVLNLIICIIEVLCAIANPFKLISALNRLFSQCIPEFLNLFPIFALIIMIISLLLLLLALIEYIISQILKFIEAILRNINALVKAAQYADATSILAIAQKLGALLCMFQNLFVLLSIFNVIIEIIRDILSLVFSIPPCQDGGSGSTDGCCTADVCPTIVKNQYTNTTGTLQYLPEVGVPIPGISIPGFNSNVDFRTESWQLYDNSQSIGQAFINIVDGYDVPVPNQVAGNKKPIFFPTDVTYTASTDPKQAAYTVDLRLFYNPAAWGRVGIPRYIRFTDCIVLYAPTINLRIWNNAYANVPNGVFYIAGGAGYEDDGTTVLNGFDSNGNPTNTQATLGTFIHMAPTYAAAPVLNQTDGYTFSNMTYTFKPNMATLLQKNLVTLGCEPSVALNRAFLNNVVAGNIGIQTQLLGDLVNGRNGNVFPDPAGAQQCLTTAVTNLRNNLTTQGVAEFQAIATACLTKLQNDTNAALGSLIGIGVDPCSSTIAINPTVQFTSQPITVTVNLNERTGLSLTTGIPSNVAADVASKLKGFATFGTVGSFSYDGYQSFVADITSTTPGKGSLMVAFDNQIFCTNILATTANPTPNHILQEYPYQFIYTPAGSTIPLAPTGEGDTDGTQPRRDAGDVSRDGSDTGGKDGV